MGSTSTFTCLHCGHEIERPDKPYCSKCGQYWNGSTRSTSLLSPISIHLPAHTEEFSHEPPPSGPPVNPLIQVKDDLLRMSAQIHQHTNNSTTEIQDTKSPLSTKPLTSVALSSEELREKLRILQEKMQPRTEVQEKVGLLRTTLGEQLSPSPPMPAIALRAAFTQDELLHKLRGLRASVSLESDNASEGSTLSEVAPVWLYQLERIHKSIDFLASVHSNPAREREIRAHLSEALRQLDVTRPYRIMLLDDSENGTSALLAALLSEEIFLHTFSLQQDEISPRILVRSCEPTEQEKMYIHFQDPQQPSEGFFRKEWLEVWSEPEQFTQKQSIASLEFALHISLLPPGSLIMLLPQGEHWQKQFEDEIPETDLLLLAVDGTRPNYAPIRRLIEQIRPYLLQERTPSHSARMFFLAATYQNSTDSVENLEITTTNLRSLLPLLPENYEQYHHHGAGKNYFFYPLWIRDAFFATVGMQRKELSQELQAESRRYVLRLQAAYERLRELFPTLPTHCSAQTFQEVSYEQHEAMLRMSNLPEISHDLPDFLQDMRQRVQLSYARTAIQGALQQLEDFAWEELDQHVHIPTRSLEALEEALLAREQQQRTERRQYLSQRVTSLRNGWKEALTQFELTTILNNDSLFHQSLSQAHTQAISGLTEHIQLGHFDSYLEHDSSQNVPTWSIDHLGREVHLRQLLSKMRRALRVSLETVLTEPAQKLAQAFLLPLHNLEQENGQLILYDPPLQPFSSALSELQLRYQTIKMMIHQKALESCRTITLSEFFQEERRLHKETPAVRALLDFVNADENAENFQNLAHQHLKAVLYALHQELLPHTERSIVDYFRSELETLDQHELYTPASQPLDSKPGDFTMLLKDLEDQMVEQLRHSEEFRRQLNTLLYPVQDDITTWYNLIKDVRKIKHTPMATRSS
jgi:hypothetical protein